MTMIRNFRDDHFFYPAHRHQEAKEEQQPQDDGPGFGNLAENDAQHDQQESEQPVFLPVQGENGQGNDRITAGEALGINVLSLDREYKEKTEEPAREQQELNKLVYILLTGLVSHRESQDGDHRQYRQRMVKLGDNTKGRIAKIDDQVEENKNNEYLYIDPVPAGHRQVFRLIGPLMIKKI